MQKRRQTRCSVLSSHAVRALLRHGADVESVIHASKVENSPIRCAVGSNALHIAALTGNIVMAKLILETQVGYLDIHRLLWEKFLGTKPLKPGISKKTEGCLTGHLAEDLDLAA